MNKTDLLRKIFNKLVPLTDDEWAAVNSCIKERTFKKGEFLCRHGQVENYLSVIYKGTCRGFYSKDGEEVSVVFMFKNDYVSAYYSFLTERPSLMSIQALTAVHVLSISKTDLDKLCDNYKTIERIGRLNAERIYRRKEEREQQEEKKIKTTETAIVLFRP